MGVASRVSTIVRLAIAAGFGLLVASTGSATAAAGLDCGAERPSGPTTLRQTADRLSGRDAIRVLAIGSSSTEGVGASAPARSYPAQLEGTLRRAWPGRSVTVGNAGIGGETLDQTLARLEKLLAQSPRPALVVWQVGTNDALAGGDEAALRAGLERGLAAIKRAGADAMLVDQQYFPRIADPARYGRFVDLVAGVAARENVPLFSRYRLMRDLARRDPAGLTGLLAADGFHMGDRGYQCLADGIGNSVSAMVARTRAEASAAAVSPIP